MTSDRPTTKPPFRGFQSPNYTMVPDELFDDLMVDLSGAELKVLLYIIRRTYGFKKDSDNISLSQMLNGVRTRDGRTLDRGVGLTKKTLLQALRSLEDQNIILTERRQSVEKGNEPTAYRLNVVANAAVEETSPPLGEKLHQGGGGETPPSPRSKNSPTQKTVLQQTDLSNSNIRMASASNNELTDTSDRSERRSRERSAPEAIGATLSQRHVPHARTAHPPDPDRDIILEYVTDWSREFGDRAPLKSSTTRAYNLYKDSGLPLETFIEGMYRARSIVKERTAAIRSTGDPASGLARKNKMAYFFAVLEDLLGLREDQGEPTDTQ